MIGTIEERAKPVLDALLREGMFDSATVVVVGSVARNAMNRSSDFDILVIRDDERRIRVKRPGEIHLQQDSRAGFLKRLEEGDDYPGWALRYGIPVSDPDGWWARQASAERDSPHWPDWRAKIGPARKRMRMAAALLETGDVHAAAEEMLFAASHIARAVLLKRGVFPLSRPEMPSQLESVDHDLARFLTLLMDGDADGTVLGPGDLLLEGRLRELCYEAERSGFSTEDRKAKGARLPQ